MKLDVILVIHLKERREEKLVCERERERAQRKGFYRTKNHRRLTASDKVFFLSGSGDWYVLLSVSLRDSALATE